jgi:hypothetical protein
MQALVSAWARRDAPMRVVKEGRRALKGTMSALASVTMASAGWVDVLSRGTPEETSM